jgi:hypothetical protein
MRGEYALLHFKPSEDGEYRFYTSPYQESAAENDTVMFLYDADQKLLAKNDDATDEIKFSSLAYSLKAGTDYWLKIRNYDYDLGFEARVTVEQDFDVTKETATPADWEQIYTNELSSIYDTDYYKVALTESAKVHLNISANKVTIEDYEGNIYGKFTPGNQEVFYLDPGTYYAKVVWDGAVNINLASSWWEDYDYDGVVDRYYAKNGVYTVVIAPTDSPGINYPSVTRISIINDKKLLTSMVPPAPAKDYDGVKVTSNNREKCDSCRNYFLTYVYDKNSAVKSNDAYKTWAKEIYGLNGIERFWATTKRFIYDPNESDLDNLHNLIELGGMIPVFGEVADGTNAVIYLIRGDAVNAGLAAVSMIPVYGNGVVGVKIFKRLDNFTPCSIVSTSVTLNTYNDQQITSFDCPITDMAKYFSSDGINHILKGTINSKNKAVGFHHEPSSSIGRITQVVGQPNSKGVYKANVEIFDGSKYILKNDPSTFFPKHWTSDQVIQAIFEVYANAYPSMRNGKEMIRKWEGVHSSGIKIEMWLDIDGAIETAYPLYD